MAKDVRILIGVYGVLNSFVFVDYSKL